MLEEAKVQKGLGRKNRERLREAFGKLQDIHASQIRKLDQLAEIDRKILQAKREIIDGLGLYWKSGWQPEEKSVKAVMGELDKSLKEWESRLGKSRDVKSPPKVPGGSTGPSDRESAQSHVDSLKRMKNTLATACLEKEQLNKTVKVEDAQQASAFKRVDEYFGEHKSAVTKTKKGLDEHLAQVRIGSEDELQRLWTDVKPLNEEIARLDGEIRSLKGGLARDEKSGGTLFTELTRTVNKRILEQQEQDLQELKVRRDRMWLQISALEGRVKTLRDMYKNELMDERTFEKTAERQLILLKDKNPPLAKALNFYCTSYRGCFQFFLYIGNFVRGDGALFQSETWTGKVVDMAAKIPLTGGRTPRYGEVQALRHRKHEHLPQTRPFHRLRGRVHRQVGCGRGV